MKKLSDLKSKRKKEMKEHVGNDHFFFASDFFLSLDKVFRGNEVYAIVSIEEIKGGDEEDISRVDYELVSPNGDVVGVTIKRCKARKL